MTAKELTLGLQAFRDKITAKPEDDRTKREDLIVQISLALEEQLRLYEIHGPASETRPADDSVTGIMRAYNEVNRERDLADVDISMAAAIRNGGRRGIR
ncbi:MAG TPA: hypothetical protein VHC90_11435 [Bryobacteraceae bacterium]|nr:hypothetical protein [Bryobacteraceae bacterium]